MQTALNRIDAQLPDGVDPQVIAGSTDDFPAVVLAATGDGDEQALAEKLRTDGRAGAAGRSTACATVDGHRRPRRQVV